MALAESTNEPVITDVSPFKSGSYQLLDRRPRTGVNNNNKTNSNYDLTSYSTSYANHFPDYEETVAYRPMTSNAFRNPYNLSDPIGASHYDEQYYQKAVKREEPIRTGTSSGNRRNNPHPSKEFMVFRFRPLKPVLNPNSDWSKSIGDTLLTQVIKNQMKSTYAQDYINNVEEKRKFEERAKHELRPSTAALRLQAKKQKEEEASKQMEPIVYNHPFKYESLYISPTRYACNKLHQTPAVGIVPGCSRFWHDIS